MPHPVTSILQRLVDAELPPATVVVANRLLTLAKWTPDGGGVCTLTWDEYAELCKRSVRRTARRHLSALRSAGILFFDWHQDWIHIAWIGCQTAPAMDASGADDAHAQRQSWPSHPSSSEDALRAPVPQSTSSGAESDKNGAGEHRPSHTRAFGVGSGGEILSASWEDPTTTTNHSPEVDDMLADLGLRPRSVRIHRELSADDVGRIIDAWEEEAAQGEAGHDDARSGGRGQERVGVGALIYRLREGITPVNRAKSRAPGKYDIPEHLRDILIG